MIRDLITNINREEITINNNHYMYDNLPVPRVTEILSSMLHEDYLMQWSNSLGFKRQSYKNTLNLAASKGQYVHSFIEAYISNGIISDYNNIPIEIRSEVINGFNSFLSWWNIININKVEIIYQEKVLISKYFAGTLDLLLKINDKIYLVDFKTSNHPSYKYFLQLSAYRYMLNELYDIEVDGLIIVMLNKKEISFREILLDLRNNTFDMNYINSCEEAFLSLVYAYYNRLKSEQLFKVLLER